MDIKRIRELKRNLQDSVKEAVLLFEEETKDEDVFFEEVTCTKTYSFSDPHSYNVVAKIDMPL